ncbi:MAG: MaoC family dehydratase [Ardenticatenaceae bacterium]|nr:MaoC family dehydratase [Ardenticatenaceae bacterium]HBY96270.1 phosphate acetyltransferase [Chloroflexota bacterium]
MKGLEIGQSASVTRVFSREDLGEYAALTADVSPISGDEVDAGRTEIRRGVVPAPLLAGLFSYLLGTTLPGRGTNYLKQQLCFPALAYADEKIVATVEITRLRPEKELVNLRTVCKNPAGQVVCEGDALVLVRDLEHDVEPQQFGSRGGDGC